MGQARVASAKPQKNAGKLDDVFVQAAGNFAKMSGRRDRLQRGRVTGEIRDAAAQSRYDAVVVGSGPNGLAAAITLAQEGHSVLVVEGQQTVGGGTRSAQLTLPGYVHDVCSAIHPLGRGSPFFRSLGLERYGLEWVQPEVPLAHPFDDGTAAVLARSTIETGETLGPDGAAWQRLFDPVVERLDKVMADALGPLRIPSHPLTLLDFGLRAALPCRPLVDLIFRGRNARALFAGVASHAMLPLNRMPTSAFALFLAALGHRFGWPVAKGGSQAIANALVRYLAELGGEVISGLPVASIDDLPMARAVLFDTTPRQLVEIAGSRLPADYVAKLAKFRYGPAVFKLDLALDGPIPWKSPSCQRASTVHVGGSLSEIALANREVAKGRAPERPFVLVGQQSLFDPTRAPEGKQTAWTYCSVPNGSTVDMIERIEAQIERFAPGFRDRILASSVMSPREIEEHDANFIGGDISGGAVDLRQTLARPVLSRDPYATPAKDIYLCSSSTPPGGGVHGMCGYWAARSALRQL